jgi:hypothetical protein
MPLKTPVVISNVTPDGNAPVRAKVGVGVPVAVTVKVPDAPSVKTVLLALVMAGATLLPLLLLHDVKKTATKNINTIPNKYLILFIHFSFSRL